ncbi:MAG TPA: hypothetical protein PKK60_03255 [archaeon]|nr:hypothetical protein [archaeon]
MDEKVSFVLDSIRKLLDLKVSDEEIIQELSGVGISKEESVELIKNARETPINNTPNQNSVEKKSVAIYDEVSSKLSMDDQVVSQLNIKDKESKNADSDILKKVKEDIAKSSQVSNSSKTTSSFNSTASNSISSDYGLKVKNSSLIKSSTPQQLKEKSSELNSSLKESLLQDSKKLFPEKETISKNVNVDSSKNESEKILINNSNLIKDSEVKNELKQSSINTESSIESKKSSDSIFNSENLLNSNKLFVNKKFDNSNYTQDNSKIIQDNSSEVDVLWKKGIVVAVNSKLSEMRKLKDEIDSNISEKVDSVVKKEMIQLRILLDSQKDLLIASNKSSLEEKQKEISFIIDSKIVELKQVNKQLSANLLALETAKSEQKSSLEQIKQMLEEARRTKAQLLVEMNSELIKSKSQAQAFLDNADKHLRELDERVNRTLELQKNIADGMIQQAEQKIESLTLQKTDELVNDLEVRLNKLKIIESEVDPELLIQKIKILDDFKKQFVETMKDNITQINVAIEEINKKNVDLDQSITQKMLVIDAKIEELTKFEKNFTEIMNNLTEKM